MPELVRVEDEQGSVLFETEFSQLMIQEIGVTDRLTEAVGTVSARADEVGAAIRTVVESVRNSFEGMATDKAAGGVLSALEVAGAFCHSHLRNACVVSAGGGAPVDSDHPVLCLKPVLRRSSRHRWLVPIDSQLCVVFLVG